MEKDKEESSGNDKKRKVKCRHKQVASSFTKQILLQNNALEKIKDALSAKTKK